MTEFRRPLSARDKKTPPDGPYEGVPDHMAHALERWYFDAIPKVTLALNGSWLELACVQIRLPLDPVEVKRLNVGVVAYRTAKKYGADVVLDLIDSVLFWCKATNVVERVENLDLLLKLGGSVWVVSDEQDELVRAVDQTTKDTYDAATAVEDSPTDDLRTAWKNAFGRQPDPSDAWDHAIKAVEHALQPVVVPNDKQATLGGIIGALDSVASWRSIYPGKADDNSVEPAVAMLRSMWPNPDRHGGGNNRPPTLDEARAIVVTAATILHIWRTTNRFVFTHDS